MTLAVAADPAASPDPGTLLYLASYLLKLKLKAEITPPDTPNLYGADIEVQGDQGDMDLEPLRGPRGFPGKARFALRRQDPPPFVNGIDDLPSDLTDTVEDIGKYWEIDTIVDGVVVERKAHVWYGSTFRGGPDTAIGYKLIQMGTRGAPGALPDLQVDCITLPNSKQAIFPDTKSWVDTSGGRLQPSWRFNLNVPAGIPGPSIPMAEMVDVDLVAPGVPASGDIFAATGRFDSHGRAIWGPLSPRQFATQFFSVPQSSFVGYNGFNQRAAIGSFTLPAMPFRYTPIVWGHLGSGGLHLSANPLMIGCEVWLGDPDTGTLISRGLGNALGEVNIMPHYSSPSFPARNISATNHIALVEAGVSATLNFDLWNEGQLGFYLFDPTNAQLMILVQPMERGVTIAPFDNTAFGGGSLLITANRAGVGTHS